MAKGENRIDGNVVEDESLSLVADFTMNALLSLGQSQGAARGASKGSCNLADTSRRSFGWGDASKKARPTGTCTT